MLKNIEIKGYRSLKDVSIDLEPLNVLIGPNGGGKSNFMDVFTLLKLGAAGSLSDAIASRGGFDALRFGSGKSSSKSLAVSLDVLPPEDSTEDHAQLRYEFELTPLRNEYQVWRESLYEGHGEQRKETLFRENGDWRGPFEKRSDPERTFPGYTNELALSQLRDPTSYPSLYDLTQMLMWMVYPPIDVSQDSPIRRPQTTRSGLRVFRGCDNTAAVLYAVSQTHRSIWADVLDVLRVGFPDLDDIRFPPEGGDGKVNLRWFEKPFRDEAGFSAEHLSDGVMRMLALVAILMTPEPPPLICIDEPEIGLHPHLVNIVAELLQSAATRTQLIVATHSPELVSKLKPNEVVVVEKEDGATVMERLSEDDLAVWRDKFRLGELWLAGDIGGRP